MIHFFALLAEGAPESLPLIRKEAEWAANFATESFATWYYGYLLIFLSEYTIATGDESVRAGMKRLALEAARGQSGVGTWGHKFAMPNRNLNGYGAMNQPGLSLCLGMVLAREAGVRDAVLDEAIAKASKFVRWYVNKGAIPYGDHLPYPAHEDNGKCSSAAVLFDLLGDGEASGFFGKMSVAAFSERERGHTGNYFNMLWALPGVSRCGPIATGAYWREQGWYYDLARDWTTSFGYQGSPVGEEEHGKYKTWDCSGGYLLAYALPLRSLLLTGKKPSVVPPFNEAQAAHVIASGRDYAYKNAPNPYERRSVEELLVGLSNWSPSVRKRSAKELAGRDETIVPTLVKMLGGTNRDARYGACEALGALGPKADAAAPELRAALEDPDPWLQCLAAEAIPALGPEARKESVSDLLALTLRPNPADPRRRVQRSAAVALFSNYPGTRGPKSILAESLEGVDRELFYPAVQSLLENEDSVARGSVQKVFKELTDRDLVTLLPAIAGATERIAPSNEMFGDGIRLAGLDLLSRLHIIEGMDLCIRVVEPTRWGLGKRIGPCLDSLARYGAHAKEKLPELREMREELMKYPPHAAHAVLVEAAIVAIESEDSLPTLVGISEFQSRPEYN